MCFSQLQVYYLSYKWQVKEMRSADGDELTFKVLLKCKTTKIKNLCWFMILQMVQTFAHGSSITCYEVINSYWQCTGATNFLKAIWLWDYNKAKKLHNWQIKIRESYILPIADVCACSPHFYTNMARTRLEQSLLWSNCRLFFSFLSFWKPDAFLISSMKHGQMGWM